MKKYIVLICLTVLMSGCLNQKHYNQVMEQSADVQSVKQKQSQQDKKIQELQKTTEHLKKILEQEMHTKGVKVEHLQPTLVKVTLPQSLLFASGSEQVNPEGRQLLKKIAEELRNKPEQTAIHIIGYTDSSFVNKKSHNSFKDNWALSSARAIAVARVLIWGEQIDKHRIHVEGRADADPIADNTTSEGRAKNRRVEIMIGTVS